MTAYYILQVWTNGAFAGRTEAEMWFRGRSLGRAVLFLHRRDDLLIPASHPLHAIGSNPLDVNTADAVASAASGGLVSSADGGTYLRCYCVLPDLVLPSLADLRISVVRVL